GSTIRKISAHVIGGKASSTRNCTTRVIHVKSGIRMKVRPGARRFRIVTMKFTAARIDAAPRIWRLRVQKSTPRFGENSRRVRLAYPNQPTAGGGPATKLVWSRNPPARNKQKGRGVGGGEAAARAPVWGGAQ